MRLKPLISIYANDKVILDSDFIFLFSYTDGFTRRLLNVELIIDKDYNYELFLKSYEINPLTGKHVNTNLKGDLPIEIKNTLTFLLSLKDIEKKLRHSFGYHAEDIPFCMYKLKVNNKIKNTCYYLFNPENRKQELNLVEQEFDKLNKDILIWVEKIYNFFSVN
jgi:hypothetical protein